MIARSGTSIGSRNAETRDRLIEAAILSLAEVGYAGSTMRRIADTAGVTQGPRQYYFPTPADMFGAVVEKIHAEADEHMKINSGAAASRSIEDKIRAIAEPAFKGCGNPRHLAMIELKLACRGNSALRDALEAKIIEYEKRTDEFWIALLESSGLTGHELKHIRTIFAATLRGLGVAIAAGGDREERMAIGETLIQISLARIAAQSRI